MRPNRFHSVYWHVTNYDVTAPNTAFLFLFWLEGEGSSHPRPFAIFAILSTCNLGQPILKTR